MSETPLISAAVSILLLQFGSRLLSFALNQLLLRASSPAALGVSTLGLDVVRDTSLFVIREGLRGAVLRSRSSPVKIKALPLYLSPLPVVLFYIWRSTLPASSQAAGFDEAIALYAASASIELLAERWYYDTLVHWETMTPKRVRIEGYAIAIKTITSLLWLHQAPYRPALEAYGIGQLAYSVTLFFGLYFLSRAREAATRVAHAEQPEDLAAIAWALTKQGVVKQFLTEGDKLVAGRLGEVDDQGAYAVALNYGSLLARIVFQPIEESSRMYFATNTQTYEQTSDALALLANVCLLYTHLSLVLVAFAPAYTAPPIHFLLGRRWSSTAAPSILRTYCYYLPFLALNGITEAFFQSTAKGRWLSLGSAWLGVCSIAFLGAVYITRGAGLGTDGLIIANCTNMALRMAFSITYVHRFAASSRWSAKQQQALRSRIALRRMLPTPVAVIAFAMAGWFVRQSEHRNWTTLKGLARHIAIGATLGLVCLAIAAHGQRTRLREVWQSRKHRRAKKA